MLYNLRTIQYVPSEYIGIVYKGKLMFCKPEIAKAIKSIEWFNR